MVRQALRVFGLPYEVVTMQDNDNYILYRLKALNGSATLSRLRTRLDDIKGYIDGDVSIVQEHGVCLRVEKSTKATYLYQDYNGYLLRHPDMILPYMVGLTSDECIVDDLAKAPHLLVAGTTGSGKSNYLHTLITSLIQSNTLTALHLIDCKKVEFSIYKNDCEVITDLISAKLSLDCLCDWMDERYTMMEKYGYDNFNDFRKSPYAVRDLDRCYHIIVVDELADLISNKEAKNYIVPRLLRIAQIGRAGGFHLVLATQRPDHTVINGTLKGNIPTRIAFNCASRWDSQVILDHTGAEHLTGNGDGLFLRNGSRNLTRFQATYIDKDYIKSKG